MSAKLRIVRPDETPPPADRDEAKQEELLRAAEARIAERRASEAVPPADMTPLGAVLPAVEEELRELRTPSNRRRSRVERSAASPPAASSSSVCPACKDLGKFLVTAEQVSELRLIPIERYSDQQILAFCDRCSVGRALATRWNRLPGEAQGVELAGLWVIEEQTAAYEAVEAFVEDPRGWLTLVGGYGAGKTTLIYATLNELHKRGAFGQYWTMPDLLDYIREAIGADNRETAQTRLQRMARLPLLAVDELDKYNATDWADEQVQKLFDYRYRERRSLATLIGYNLSGAERIPRFVRSRISDGRFRYVEMRGADLRPAMEDEEPPVGNDPAAVWDRGEYGNRKS